ncbi:hypothetical protein [Variovorax paradoxus]|uniref:hypothetical protein n=1 Tax=Variovorax paradoxus TaxID=34073 RepID=UPI0019311C7C|nr:hypothetical protein INQ48_30100 [Variovorax paradoxus]
MNHRHHARVRWQRRAAVCLTVCLAVSLAGCSSFDPYQRSQRVDTPVRQLGKEAAERYGDTELLAGDLHGALVVLKDQRREWYESLSTQARMRAITQLGLIGLTAAAFYGGLKSGVTSNGDRSRLALAGGVGLAAYTGSTWFINPAQEQAYVDGIRDLTCAMLNIEPLRMSEEDFRAMRDEREHLSGAINELDRLLRVEEAVLRYPPGDTSPHALVRIEARDALGRARRTLASSGQLLEQLRNSGVVMMREGDLVFARVAARINTTHRSVSEPDSLLSQATGIAGSFRAVKIDPASESQGVGVSAASVAAGSGGGSFNSAATGSSTAKVSSNPDLEPMLRQIARLHQQDSDAAAKKIEVLEKRVALLSAKKPVSERDNQIAVKLATATSYLYAFRRPLSHRLLAFHEARKSVGKNSTCFGGASAMNLSSAGDAKVKPGDVYPITVTGVTAVPKIALKGPADHEIVIGPGPNQYIVRVNIRPDAKGVVDIAVSDQASATEDIQLTVDDR